MIWIIVLTLRHVIGMKIIFIISTFHPCIIQMDTSGNWQQDNHWWYKLLFHWGWFGGGGIKCLAPQQYIVKFHLMQLTTRSNNSLEGFVDVKPQLCTGVQAHLDLGGGVVILPENITQCPHVLALKMRDKCT